VVSVPAHLLVAPSYLERRSCGCSAPQRPQVQGRTWFARTWRGRWGTAERTGPYGPTPSARPSVANTGARHCFLASASGPKLWPDVCAVINLNMAVAYSYICMRYERFRDFEISGGRSHGGAEARRKQREETTTGHKGNWRVPCSCLCVKHSWLPTGVLHCPGHPSCAGA
jgi:hypothetical protein